MREVFNINVPYIVRFMWASSEAQRVWEDRINDARLYLLNRFPKVLVESGLAGFAPTTRMEEMSHVIGTASIVNHYYTRWSTNRGVMSSLPSHLALQVGIIGDQAVLNEFTPTERWDLLRDIYQLALAPECCKKAYFENNYRDPYHDLYDGAGKIKRMKSGEMNSLHAPLGLFISPIVPCSLHCEHAHAKAKEIGELIKEDSEYIYDTLKMVVEMPFRIDSYRGMACVDTPMFKGVFATDAYKDKYILDIKPSNPEVFHYGLDWVARGARFPFKGQFSELFGGGNDAGIPTSSIS